MFTNEHLCNTIIANERMVSMELYNQKEFAKLIGVTVQTLKRWEKRGYIKPLRTIPHRPIYTDEHLNRFLGKETK